jgi:hypothetical protein
MSSDTAAWLHMGMHAHIAIDRSIWKEWWCRWFLHMRADTNGVCPEMVQVLSRPPAASKADAIGIFISSAA